MIKKLIPFLAVGIVAAGWLLPGCTGSQNNDRSIVIYYENDVHCQINGYAALAGLRDASADTAHVAVVSSGDFLQGGTAGAISDGAYIIDIMQAVNYDAVALGNHEFDYKIPRMLTLLERLGAPIVCVNLRDLSTGQMLYRPYVIKQMGRKKVAFVGVLTPETMQDENYALVDSEGNFTHDLCATEVYALTQQAVDQARAEGADYIIVLSHLGEKETLSGVDSHSLIANTRGIDALFDGHSHTIVECQPTNSSDSRPVLITQTGTKFQNIGKLVISPDGHFSVQLLPIDSVGERSARVMAVTDSIKDLMHVVTSLPICESEVPIRINAPDGTRLVRSQETNAGDLVADAYRHAGKSDIAICNGGGIRADMPAGAINYGHIIDMLPYDNYLQVISITGRQLVDLLTLATSSYPNEDGDFPQISGMRFTLHPNATVRISDVRILNSKTLKYVPIDLNATYSLTTSDYCVSGGGMRGFLKGYPILHDRFDIHNKAVATYLTDALQGHIGKEYAHPQGRIIIK